MDNVTLLGMPSSTSEFIVQLSQCGSGSSSADIRNVLLDMISNGYDVATGFSVTGFGMWSSDHDPWSLGSVVMRNITMKNGGVSLLKCYTLDTIDNIIDVSNVTIKGLMRAYGQHPIYIETCMLLIFD